MHYQLTLSNCTTTEAILLWFHLGIMLIAMVGFGMMVINIMKRNYNAIYFLGLGALLMFFPTSQERMGIIGRRVFLVSISIFLLLLYVISKSNICNVG